MSRVEITIDRLVLDGVRAPDRAAFADAMAAELERLLQPSTTLGDHAAGGPATPAVTTAADARSLGITVARAVYARVAPSIAAGSNH